MFLLLIFGLIFFLACMFLLLVILLQSGKGGGLSGMLGGANNPLTDTLGAGAAEKTLNKWTGIAAALFFIIALLLTLQGNRVFKRVRLSDRLKAEAAPEVVTTQPDEAAPATPGTENATPNAEAGQETPAAPAAPATPAEASQQ
ncbi:MAG TPA: preprotein translocase subunit SecG [Candidatus Sumerlaeota bacterium]|nr:preprotein translocase subunit SecG [Candidatus Sumerlaeota bacterium]